MKKTPIQIRFSDVDHLGHVNNSIYNQYLDVARVDYMNASLGKLIDWNAKALVLVHVENDFLHPTHLNDIITVESEVIKIGNRSVTMRQQIVDDKGAVKMKSTCIFSTLDVKKNESFLVPDEWRAAVEKFEGKKLS